MVEIKLNRNEVMYSNTLIEKTIQKIRSKWRLRQFDNTFLNGDILFKVE